MTIRSWLSSVLWVLEIEFRLSGLPSSAFIYLAIVLAINYSIYIFNLGVVVCAFNSTPSVLYCETLLKKSERPGDVDLTVLSCFACFLASRCDSSHVTRCLPSCGLHWAA